MAKKKIIYWGVFFSPEEESALVREAAKCGNALTKDVPNKHITLAFKPESIPAWVKWGTKVTVEIIGYGNNGRNEGFLVSFRPAWESLSEIKDYVRNKVPAAHITLSLSEGAAAVDTAKLEYTLLDKPFVIEGTLGYFNGKVRFE